MSKWKEGDHVIYVLKHPTHYMRWRLDYELGTGQWRIGHQQHTAFGEPAGYKFGSCTFTSETVREFFTSFKIVFVSRPKYPDRAHNAAVERQRSEPIMRLRYTVMSDNARISTIRLPQLVAEVHDVPGLYELCIFESAYPELAGVCSRRADRDEAVQYHSEVVQLYQEATGAYPIVTEGEGEIEGDRFNILEATSDQ